MPHLNLSLEPESQKLERLLEDDVLYGQVKADLLRRYPRTATRGRSSAPVEVILRLLIIKRL